MILDKHKELVIPLVESIADVRVDFAVSEALGCVRDGALVGGVVYSCFNGATCEMSVAGVRPGWVTREFLLAAFHYPFVQLGLIKVIGLVRSDNTRALEFDTKLGFTLETAIADVYGYGIDCVVMSMRREDCRWLPAAEKRFSELAA